MADAAKASATTTHSAAAARSPDAKSNTSQKQHSQLSYISPALFHNRRLKRKRLKWQALLLQPRRTTKTKTDRIKQKIKSSYQLNPDVTINLVSDDDDDDDDEKHEDSMNMKLHSQQNHMLQPLYVYTGAPMEVSKIPNITLVPVQQILQKHSLLTQKNTKRKRKARQPQRLSQPQIMNNDSIVLSDDEDEIEAGYPAQLQQHHKHHNGKQQPETTISPIPRTQSTPQSKPPVPIMSATTLDEEVTVSLVPRSSAGGTCGGGGISATNNNVETSLFPMLPDETTVHTVISNRTYELSLAKLREGLASCGMPEFSNDPKAAAAAAQNSMSPTQRRKPPITPPQAPISLKLSSDLSISLISDDDEEEQIKQLMKAEQMLQQQTQLSVQHLQFPPAAMTVVSRPRH